MEWSRFEAACFGDDLFVAEVEDANLRVGCLGDIRVAEAAPLAEHAAAQAGHAEAPAADVERVDVVVADLAVAGVPEPVPVIVELWPRELGTLAA
jgi:hypothetical protein